MHEFPIAAVDPLCPLEPLFSEAEKLLLVSGRSSAENRKRLNDPQRGIAAARPTMSVCPNGFRAAGESKLAPDARGPRVRCRRPGRCHRADGSCEPSPEHAGGDPLRASGG